MLANTTEAVRQMAIRMRNRSLRMALDADRKGSHLGAALSVIEIFAALYGQVLRYDVNDPENPDRDRLIVSKGHCVLAYYTALCEAGFLQDEELNTFEQNGAWLHGHATRDVKKGVEFSGGSLGMGISFAVGVAIAAKSDRRTSHVYVLIGDGECNEGIVWESCMAASHYQLDNLTIIVDDNKLQYDGESSKVMNMISLADKFKAFGIEPVEIDGHDVDAVLSALRHRVTAKPVVVIASTVKGKGVSFMEHKKEWHHSRLTAEQYEIAMSEQPKL